MLGTTIRVCPKCSKQISGSGKICRACGGILDDAAAGKSLQEPIAAEPTGLPQTATAHPPLGMPSGSVRALLTLLIVAVVIVQMVRGQEVELLWTETLMIALAHYFTSRRFIKLPPEMIHRLTDQGAIETEAHPLFLPRHSIRAILILAFAWLAFYLAQHGQLMEPQSLSILGVVFAYLLGMVARFRGLRGWEDLKAAVVLLVLMGTAAAYLLDRGHAVPHFVRNTTLALVLFYFGSR
jgi:hypothetical protein